MMWTQWTLIKLIAVGTAFVITALFAHHSGKRLGQDQIQSQWNAEKAQEASRAAKQVAAMAQQVQEAQNHAKAREQVLRRDADAARAVVASLRQQLTEADQRIATAPHETLIGYARTQNELFAECTRAYQELAATADGHASDAVMLHEAWPMTGKR
jgi:hypothetical protein